MVTYFCKFSRDERKMPVVWHQNLLTFVQRYKYDLEEKQKQVLIDLTKKQFHKDISPEVKRELKAQAPLDPRTGLPMGTGSRRNSVALMDIESTSKTKKQPEFVFSFPQTTGSKILSIESNLKTT